MFLDTVRKILTFDGILFDCYAWLTLLMFDKQKKFKKS